MTAGRRLASSASWGFADQVLSSLINFGFGIAVARVGTPAEFGIYGLLFGAYLIAINITRPLAIEPLIIRFTEAPHAEWTDRLAAALGMIVVVAAGLAVVVGGVGTVVGLAIDAELAIPALILAAGLVGLCLQDGLRLSFFAAREGRAAFTNDLWWASTFLAIGLGLAVAGAASLATIVAAWVVGANVAALAGLRRVHAPPRPRAAATWWREQRSLARPLLGEHLVTSVVTEATPYLIGLIAGLSAVAALRAAQLLLGPFNVIFQALSLVALPEAVRLAERSRTRLTQAAIALSAIMAGLVTITGLVIANVPDAVGETLLGQTWTHAQEVMVPYTLGIAAVMAAIGAMLGLRALAQARESFAVGGARAIMTLVGAVVGAAAGGAPGAAIGIALGGWLGAAGSWWRFLRRVGDPRPRDPEPAGGGDLIAAS